jgi:hypothetical protein
MLIRFQPKVILFACVVLGLLLALNRPLLCAQNGTGTVEGVVRDTAKQPLADVKVSLDDQVEGRTQATPTDAAGHFRFAGIGASTYILHVRRPGYRDAAEGPFASRQGARWSADGGGKKRRQAIPPRKQWNIRTSRNLPLRCDRSEQCGRARIKRHAANQGSAGAGYGVAWRGSIRHEQIYAPKSASWRIAKVCNTLPGT